MMEANASRHIGIQEENGGGIATSEVNAKVTPKGELSCREASRIGQ
jgi:hypothetical protein